MRTWLWLMLLLLLPAGVGCSVLTGQNPNSILFGQQASEIQGFAAIVCLNESEALVQVVVVLAYPQEPPRVWVIPVTPNSWDSILVECGFSEIRVLSVTPVDLETGDEQEQILYDGDALVEARDIVCGSIVLIETADAPEGSAGPPVTIAVSAVPESVPSTNTSLMISALAPGPDSGLALLRPEVPDGIEATLTASWEDPTGRVFTSEWLLSGGRAIAALIECPIERVALGNLIDAEVPGATLNDGALKLAAPAPLTSGEGFACGDAVTLRLVEAPETAEGFQLEIEALAVDPTPPPVAFDLFGNIRQLLDEKGFAGRLSNAGNLLPTPTEPTDETP